MVYKGTSFTCQKEGCLYKNDKVHACNTGTRYGYHPAVPKCEVHNIRL
jgi:hypothetical protein